MVMATVNPLKNGGSSNSIEIAYRIFNKGIK
jgi:hypothetical protein